MIGQKNLIKTVNDLIVNNKFPLFSIILGSEGSGKNMLVRKIVQQLNAEHHYIENKIDNIRQFISGVSNDGIRKVYIIEDLDLASINAKNSLLKILEESPKNSHIIALAVNKEKILDTILSRAILFEMEPYTKEELSVYLNLKGVKNKDNYLKVCTNIGELETVINKNVNNIIDLAEKVILNMSKSTLSNALLIPNKLEMKDDLNELPIFINALEYNLSKIGRGTKSNQELDRIIKIQQLLSNFKNQLTIKSLNRRYIFDEFLINMWQVSV